MFKKFYGGLTAVGSNLQSVFLLAVRLFWGYMFFQTGLGKLRDIEPIVEYFKSLGIPYPEFNAYAAGGVECICGFCLLIGFLSRLVAIPLIGVMVVAFLTASLDALKGAYDDPQKFVKQLPFTFLLAALIIFIFGPGKASLDYLLCKLCFKKKQDGVDKG